MRIKANCKINIGLDIVERRADGFHNISSMMYPIRELYDTLDFEPKTEPGVEFIGCGLIVDCPAEDNLCVKAYKLMQSHYPTIGGLKITLRKQVPFGAGLGGGSSDATAVILAINSIFELSLSEERMIELATHLGSDTAFFVRNTPQLCSGRGEIMSSVDVDLTGKYLALIKPNIHVSTREAYAGVKPAEPTTHLSELLKRPIEEWQGCVKNDFEPHIFEAYPLLSEIKQDLIDAGALYAAMSGSGSTIYGIFNNELDAKSEQLESYSPYILKL